MSVFGRGFKFQIMIVANLAVEVKIANKNLNCAQLEGCLNGDRKVAGRGKSDSKSNGNHIVL
jgi:hypothetical protein